MRVTDNINFNSMRDSIHRSKSRMDDAQKQMSSLKKLNAPSDDPVGAIKVMEIRTDKVNNEQFVRNIQLAENFLSNSDHVLQNLSDIVLRAKEIALNQASGASSTEDTRLGVAEEVSQLFQNSVALANTRIADRYLFGGYQTNRSPIGENGEYRGDDGEMMVEVAREVYVSMNIPGLEAFNSNPEFSYDAKQLYGAKEGEEDAKASPEFQALQNMGQENVNLFNELNALRISLLTGDTDGIRSTLERLDQLHASITSNRAKIGSRLNGLNGMMRSLERHNLTNANLNQNIEDADMVEVMNDIAREETVFRSVLNTSQRLVQPTLLDFLK